MSPAARTPEASLIRAIGAAPSELANYFSLARHYREGGQPRKAEMTLRRVIDIEPMHLRAWLELGTLSSHRDDWRSAVDAFERACALDGHDPANWIRYGAASLANRDLRRATQVRDELVTRFPDRWEGHLLTGHLHKLHGDVAAAGEAYRLALECNPRQTDAWHNLVDLLPPAVSDTQTAQLQGLRADVSLSHRDSANVLFSLARIYDQAEQIDEAMVFYREANAHASQAMRELGIIYDRNRVEAETARIMSLFDRDRVSAPLAPIDLDMRLIFITGMPRSGTTLVERILGSHPAVASGGEMPFMQECLAELLEAHDSSRSSVLAASGEQARTSLCDLRERYLDGAFERDLDGEYVIDKLPANFAAIGLIRILFPDALVIHCGRDPVATCWSLYTAHFGMHLPYNASLQDLAHYYRNVYSKLMHHWRQIPGLDIIDVSYERLVSDPEAKIREVIERCGLPWDDRCLRFHENDSPVFTANAIAVRKPISSGAVQRWRRFEKHLEPLVQAVRASAEQTQHEI